MPNRHRLKQWQKVALSLAFLLAVSPVEAEDTGSLPFDLFRSDSELVAWIDFSSLLTSARVDGLKEGVALEVRYTVSLTRPRRLWGERLIESGSGAIKIGYEIVDREFELGTVPPSDSALRGFSSLAELHRFLADSITVSLVALDRLQSQSRYRLSLQASCISLTTFNLTGGEEYALRNTSPLRYLFSTFLELTGYGRTDFEARSELFRISDLPAKE